MAPTLKKILIIGGCGHIGSRLSLFLSSRPCYLVQTVDREERGPGAVTGNLKKDYQELSASFIQEFDVVIMLAATSSVKTCQQAPREALENNILHFFDLLQKLGDHQKFIYASSSSVYTGTGENAVSEDWREFHVANMYDLTKYAADAMVPLYCKAKYYGLRFGTVCGYSPNERSEIMIHAMMRSALTTGQVHLQNAHAYRPILALADLCHAVESILLQDQEVGIYNLASFVSSIGDIAQEVSRLCGAELILGADSSTYDFSMSSDKFMQSFDFDFKGSVLSIVSELLIAYESENLPKEDQLASFL